MVMEPINKLNINGSIYDLSPIIIHNNSFHTFNGITVKEGSTIVIKQGHICIWQFNFVTPSSYPSQPNEYGMYNIMGISNGVNEGFPVVLGDYVTSAQRIHGSKTDGSKTVTMLVTYDQGNLLAWMNNDPNLLNCEFWGMITFYDKR